MSRLVRSLSSSDWFLAAARGPVAARVAFDHDRHRFVIVAGPALDFYRRVQASVAGYALGAAVHCR